MSGTQQPTSHKYNNDTIDRRADLSAPNAPRKHTSTLNIPIKTTAAGRPEAGELGEGRTNHHILSHEIDRMNARMRDLRKSFEDLTGGGGNLPSAGGTVSSSASSSSRVKNNFFERSTQHNSNMPVAHAEPTTLPRRNFTTASGGLGSKDDFEREVENFRRNFEEFRHPSGAGNNSGPSRYGQIEAQPPSTARSLGGTSLPITQPSTYLDSDSTQRYVEGPDGRRIYRVTLDMNDFAPADIKVKVVDGNILKVSARADHITSTGGNVQREFNREFTIPSNVDVDALVSRIDARGVMNLEAPAKSSVALGGAGDRAIDSPKFRSSTSSSFNATTNEFIGSPPTKLHGSGNTTSLFDDFDSKPRRKYSWTGSLRNFPTSPPSAPTGNWGTSTFDRRRDLFKDPEGNNNKNSSSLFSSTLSPRNVAVAPSNSTLGVATSGPFKLSFDMRDYDPDEIKISVTDNMLKVRAKHEERSSTGTVSREFNREYTIPRHVNPDAIKSTLGRDGTLTVESTEDSRHDTPKLNGGSSGATSANRGVAMGTDLSPPLAPFKLRFDMAAYQPDEIKVKVTGGMVRVEARHEEFNPNVLREFSREYVIPRGIDPDQLRSSLSPSGILTIEATTAVAPF